MRKATLALASAILVLSGCGDSGSHHHKPGRARAAHAVSTSSAQPLPAHPCDPMDFAMQCGLFGQPRSGPTVAQGVPATYGVDFAWGGPRSCSAMRSIGARFAWSYWSYDTSGKNWTRALVDEFHRCGIQTAGGWETTALRAEAGPIAGASDAMAESIQATRDGNTNGALVLAVDCDCPGYKILGYFQGAHGVLGSRTNAYGGYYQLLYLYEHGVVGHLNFQTYAWSRSLWLPSSIAPLEQYLNGSSYDNDRAIAPNFGQFPAPPPPGPSPAQLSAWRAARNHAFSLYHANGCRAPQDRYYCRHSGADVVSNQEKLWTKYPRWPLFGPGARTRSLVAWIVRPEVSVWSQRRDASRRVAQRRGCFQKPDSRCRQLNQEYTWFNERATGTVKAFS